MSAMTYPVRVDASLDDHLSRWLWLVKWVLAVPHYIVLVFMWAAFVVLSIIAFFAILFSRSHPRSIFDFVLGMNRWVLRVAADAVLMTDKYPPFRLDAGGHDPGSTLAFTMPTGSSG